MLLGGTQAKSFVTQGKRPIPFALNHRLFRQVRELVRLAFFFLLGQSLIDQRQQTLPAQMLGIEPQHLAQSALGAKKVLFLDVQFRLGQRFCDVGAGDAFRRLVQVHRHIIRVGVTLHPGLG